MPPSGMAAVTIAALGVVFGDIGTSPLYALKECFHGPHAIAVNPVNVMGVLSLIVWSLVMVVAVKYVFFVTKADNDGEGGVFALLAILTGAPKVIPKKIAILLPYLAICGGALLYSDGIITPAISVLSAVEGLKEAIPEMGYLVVPITCAILVLLFSLEKYGTARIGRFFGPVMLVWFLAIGTVGIVNIIETPGVLTALNPACALRYFQENQWHGFIVLGAVILCITGGEALYADLGHFGRLPIRNAWLSLACPCLLLNYLGQGALLLRNPGAAAQHPFYQAVPQTFLLPMLALAAAATVIASQSVISGIYSLTQQAIHFGFLPRMRVVHTSSHTKGQIYLPAVNALLMTACIGIVLTFRDSSGLAAAYGLAVTGAMNTTTLLYCVMLYFAWQWPWYKVLPLWILFSLFDLPFLGASLIKVLDGGWLPMLISLICITIMTTWQKGRQHLRECFDRMSMPLSAFLRTLREIKIARSPGIGVYMTMNQHLTPMPLARTVALIHTVPEKMVLLTIQMVSAPYVATDKRLKVDDTHKELGLYRMIAHYGYMEHPTLAEISELSKKTVVYLPLYDCTFYLGRETILPSKDTPVMQAWRRGLFIFLSRNAWNAITFFDIPSSRVVEIGTHLEV